MLWKEWAGYFAVRAYDMYHEREYFAFRHAAGLLDVTPLFKYDVRGRDAAAFLSFVMTRDCAKLKLGQVAYGCWCDERGKLLDDGTIWRLEEHWFRVTSAEPNLRWFIENTHGFDVSIEDISDRVAAVSVQGPRSRDVLKAVVGGVDFDGLKFFRMASGRVNGFEVMVTRTGYTGDLGYEVWVENAHALKLWDALMEGGRPVGLLPAGLDALDNTRVEAGFVLSGVDYFPANRCLIESRKSSPFEAGLGWTVQLDRDEFIGRDALAAEKARGSPWSFVGLEVDWDEFARLHEAVGLPPAVCSHAWRDAVPVYSGGGGEQVGQATSGSWSPILKRNLALATVRSEFAAEGTILKMEVTVEYVRHAVKATVVRRPFFDPERKKA
jgi:aminomethyltransferase